MSPNDPHWFSATHEPVPRDTHERGSVALALAIIVVVIVCLSFFTATAHGVSAHKHEQAVADLAAISAAEHYQRHGSTHAACHQGRDVVDLNGAGPVECTRSGYDFLITFHRGQPSEVSARAGPAVNPDVLLALLNDELKEFSGTVFR